MVRFTIILSIKRGLPQTNKRYVHSEILISLSFGIFLLQFQKDENVNCACLRS